VVALQKEYRRPCRPEMVGNTVKARVKSTSDSSFNAFIPVGNSLQERSPKVFDSSCCSLQARPRASIITT
jgi:hypothetical protein